MSDDQLSKKGQEALDRWTRTVIQELAEGKSPEAIVRELTSAGWSKDSAEQFVAELEQRWREIAASPEAREELLFQTRFPDMRPLKSLPSLFAVHGFGTGLFGRRDYDPETGTYVKTHCFWILFIPVIALGAYRLVGDRSGGWRLFGKVPLSKLAKTWNVGLLGAVLALIAWGGWIAYTSSDNYQAGRKLAQADHAAEEGRLVEASGLYSEVARGRSGYAPAAQERLAGLVERPELDGLPMKDLTELFRHVALAPGAARPAAFARGLSLVKARAQNAAELAVSLRLLQTIAPLGGPAATQDALKSFLGGPLDAVSAAVAAEALRTACEIAGPDGEQAVILRGLDWLEKHAQADPREALALADVLAESPKADPRRIAAQRRRHLERIVKADPNDVKAAVELALLLEKEGDAKRVEALLTPHRGKLGDGEGARMLGQLLAAQGKFDAAYGLLNPYLEKRLGDFHEAQQAFRDAIVRAQQAPQVFCTRKRP